jgi:RNA polymerase sigma-70 factor (ECF subfamily)
MGNKFSIGFLFPESCGFDLLTAGHEYRSGETFGSPRPQAALLIPVSPSSKARRVKTETELIQEALAGNSQSYGELVERFQDRLFNAMLHVVGSPDEAEDVVQDSFVQAYIKLDTFQGNSQFFTWLYRIAFNNALSRQRRRRGELSIEQSREITGSDPEDRHESPEEPLMREERVVLVTKALTLLSEEHRMILVMREMQEHSYEDIAEMLGINIGTVRSRLSRARNQLKIQLEELMDR